MITEHQETRMQEVVQAITQYHPSFIDEIRGCTPAEISRIQAIVSRPLPACYVDFLLHMGHSTGSLALYKDSDFSFNSVLEYHSDEDIPRAPERYLLFGIAEDDPYYNFYLDCSTPQPQVVRFPTPETVEEYSKVISKMGWLASSLYEFVFSKAFAKLHLSHFPHEGMLAEDTQAPVRLEQAESVLTKLGFTRHQQSTESAMYYERPTATVILRRFVGSPLAFTVASYDRRELAKVSDVLSQQLRLVVPR
ncbi:SMI1/KNR4 family protein [Archangium sp.]|uniref:SMI1/KNR4 family protein n=1 Tax=Archangium sp. TaxID=1872627 RepID=UPI002D3BB692|nr:SMI1/KNR4 family protein [Archangium sp.]HYO55821.1 SMI1/KNR4 family protein [Archangium sp.]